MTYFLYCALGEKRYQREAVYSIISLLKMNPNFGSDIKIVFMVTDTEGIPSNIINHESVIITQISNDLKEEWIGSLHYVFRIKIKAITWLFEKDHDSNIIFFDTDTVIKKELSPLIRYVEEGGFLLYSRCQDMGKAIRFTENEQNFGSAKEHDRILMYRDILRQMYFGYDNKKFMKPEPLFIYNSGVIGINGRNRDLLSDVLQLNDVLVERYHYGTEEEIAFSWIFQQNGNVLTCEDDFIYHYVESKNTCYVAGYLLNALSTEDEMALRIYLEENDLLPIDVYQLTIDDISTFTHYILSKKKKAFEAIGNDSLLDAVTYFDTESEFYKKVMSPSSYKKYIKREKLYFAQADSIV